MHNRNLIRAMLVASPLVACASSFAIAPAWAATISFTAPSGTAGTDGAVPGQSGTAGGDGPAAVLATTTPGDAVNQATANGGAGGKGGNGADGVALGSGGAAGAGGNGGDADAGAASNDATAPGITATTAAFANGGNGGNAGSAGAPGPGAPNPASTGAGATGGNGGSAVADAQVTLTNPPDGAFVSSASATAVGGIGGVGLDWHDTGLYSGGDGGRAQAAATANATDGSNLQVDAIQTGGTGGAGSLHAGGGRGADSTMANAATGSTSGSLSLYQIATGGDGGSSKFSTAGKAGNASSTLQVSDALAHDLTAQAVAQGGHGGNTATGTQSAGGDAISLMEITSTRMNAEVNILSKATGGDGGGDVNSVMAPRGQAQSTALASSLGTGGSAAASNAQGRSGAADATAISGDGAGHQLKAVAQAPLNAPGGAFAQARAVTGTAPFVQWTAIDLPNVTAESGFAWTYSHGAVLPDAGTVSTLLIDHPILLTAIGNFGTVTGIGSMGSRYTEPAALTTYTTSATYTFDPGTNKYLSLSLFHPTALNTGFDSAAFSVLENGVNIFSQSFTTLAEANLFFTDNALGFGAWKGGSLNFEILFQLTSAATFPTGQGFNFAYALGGSAEELVPNVSSVPIPPAVLLFASALAGLGVLSGRARGARRVAS